MKVACEEKLRGSCCGYLVLWRVIFYELLAGFLPFDDCNLINLYKKRITIPEIIEDEWFQVDYKPATVYDSDKKIYVDAVAAGFDSTEEQCETGMKKSSSFINAFQLISMSHDLDLSCLFEHEEQRTEKTMLVSKHTFGETMKKVKDVAADATLLIERVYNKMKIHLKMARCSRSYGDLSAENIEVAPTHCVIELSRSSGKLHEYGKFCQRFIEPGDQKLGHLDTNGCLHPLEEQQQLHR